MWGRPSCSATVFVWRGSRVEFGIAERAPVGYKLVEQVCCLVPQELG